jgi:hypothetical protein
MSTFIKKSLGKLRPNVRTKPRSPAFVGKIALQRATVENYLDAMERSGTSEVYVPAAVWPNQDVEGIYLSIQLSPLFEPANTSPMTMDEFLHVLDEEQPKN